MPCEIALFAGTDLQLPESGLWMLYSDEYELFLFSFLGLDIYLFGVQGILMPLASLCIYIFRIFRPLNDFHYYLQILKMLAVFTAGLTHTCL